MKFIKSFSKSKLKLLASCLIVSHPTRDSLSQLYGCVLVMGIRFTRLPNVEVLPEVANKVDVS